MRLWVLGLALCGVLSGCSDHIRDVQTYQYQGGDMRGGLIAYDTTPPAGGPYSPLWQQCGEYQQPIYPEYAVHSLARGAVWISYRPDLPPADLAKLREAASGQSFVLLSPLPEQSSPVVLSAWNAQLRLDSAQDSRIARFITTYAQAAGTPEAGGSCSGGYQGVVE